MFTALRTTLAVLVAFACLAATAQAGNVKGCTNWTHGSNPTCAGVWFQAGPGADAYGGTNMHQITTCATPSPAICNATDNTGPVIGEYVDDTTPCPASLDGTPGTHYVSGIGWVGQTCVQYWTTDEHNHGTTLIYDGLYPGMDGTTSTRFTYGVTLREWFGPAHPTEVQQGWILGRSYMTAAQFTSLWNYCAMSCPGSVLAYV